MTRMLQLSNRVIGAIDAGLSHELETKCVEVLIKALVFEASKPVLSLLRLTHNEEDAKGTFVHLVMPKDTRRSAPRD